MPTIELERNETLLELLDEQADWSVKICVSLFADGTWGFASSTKVGRLSLESSQIRDGHRLPSKAAAATYAADAISTWLKTLPAKNGRAKLRLKAISRALDGLDKSLAGQPGSAEQENKAAVAAETNSGTAAEGSGMAKVNTEANEPGEQGVMFPDLADSPETKGLMRLCKALLKIREDRKTALNESKEKEDKTQEQVVEKMHAIGIDRFTHQGYKVELIRNSEKVKIKPDPDVEDENGDD